MKRFRVLACAVLLSFSAVAIFAADPSLPDLFKRAKERFSAGDYKGSLSDFELLDTNSAKPGFENDRTKLLPVVTFYRGANMAALGRKAEAKDAFIAYLGFVPTAAIASPPFPKTTVDLFEQARNEAGTTSQTMTAAYAAFAAPANWTLASDERWISGQAPAVQPASRWRYGRHRCGTDTLVCAAGRLALRSSGCAISKAQTRVSVPHSTFRR